jgi:transposase
MGTVTTIGLDLAKNVFQVHGVDACQWCSGIAPAIDARSFAEVLREIAVLLDRNRSQGLITFLGASAHRSGS